MSSLVATGSFTIIDVNDGMRTASLTMYQWSLNAPTTFPGGSSTYTWASQAFTAPATLNGWSITPPASAAAGQSLWVCFADYTDNLSTATSTITWSTALAYPIGAAGADSSNYALSLSSSVISKSVLNILTPTSSTASIYKSTGTDSPALYAGRFVIATSPDGTTYTDVYTSSADESSKAYTIPVTAKTIRVRAYLAGGVTTLLDEEVITIVTDGSSGIDSVNNIVAVLNNENQSIPADNAGTTGAFSAVSTMAVYNGAVDDSANWTYTKVDSNATSTITGAVATVTALSADTGTVTITATRSAAAQVNILSGSETFDATWQDATVLGNTGVVVAASTIPAPNGALTAKKITASANLVLFYRKIQPFAINQYSVSTYIYVPTQAGITSWRLSWDFADTTPVTINVPTYYVFDKWVRVEGTVTTSASLTFLDWNMSMNGLNLTAGTVFHVWGAMCKTGTASGKYIPYLAPVSKVFTLAKAKAGVVGAQGPSVVVISDRPTTYTATDGTLDSGQANIVFTTLVSGVTTPTYVWTFSGFQTAPTNSGTSTQTITAAQFGTSKSATVTCTVNGVYLDTITVVRLEKTTAAANATVGATLNDIYYSALTLNGNATIVAPLVSKVGGAAAYDTQAYSVQSYVGNCACRFKVSQLNAYIVVGLNTDPTTDANYTSIDYGIICNNAGLVYVSESGTFGSAYTHPVTGATVYSINDVFEVSYAGTTISYLWNGSVIKTTTVAANLTLFLDSSILTPNSSFTLLTFGQYKSGNVTGQINAGNASTYIANAAIQTAHIGDANISTLKIAGNAVTVPMSATSSSIYVSCGAYSVTTTTICTLSGSFIGQPVLLNYSASYTISSGFAFLSFSLYRDSVLIYGSGGGSMLSSAGGSTGNCLDTPTAGAHTYTLVIYNDNSSVSSANSVTVTKASIASIECKR